MHFLYANLLAQNKTMHKHVHVHVCKQSHPTGTIELMQVKNDLTITATAPLLHLTAPRVLILGLPIVSGSCAHCCPQV